MPDAGEEQGVSHRRKMGDGAGNLIAIIKNTMIVQDSVIQAGERFDLSLEEVERFASE